ncbi:hypothetical protein M3P05_15805 [Sansalvadorimonas sp. 2012CJ34-2]|uniref:Uncharacterized protein n=1 Tax=Parendozoicomonas callyspongiae TaxID=2942213 RepID=A0ABT0PJE0_9GAMM|nr:hypothetical protein [Sansalvadorimonas sp. 2012CJ34-2]MCL6271386.1 hypothetical protein [Sansalvadorimonas sp. 2012CJ34-2]
MSANKEEKPAPAGGQISSRDSQRVSRDSKGATSQPLPHKLENQILQLEKLLSKIRDPMKVRSSSN